MGDDGIGPAAVAMLEEEWIFPENVTLVDGGTKGAYLLPLVMDCTHLLIIDAVDMKAAPGTFYDLEGERLDTVWRGSGSGVHDASVPELIACCKILDSAPQKIRLIGAQPESLEMNPVTLSEPVAKALPEICDSAIQILREWRVAPLRRESGDSGFSRSLAVPRLKGRAA